MSDARRIVVTGMAVLSPLGEDADTLLDNLLNGRSGIGRWTGFDRTIATKVGGSMEGFDPNMDATRDMVRDVILANTYRSLAFLDLKDIDTGERFDDLGAASLDIITIVADSMRELNVKVPVEQLNGLANIDALIDALTAAVNARRGR